MPYVTDKLKEAEGPVVAVSDYMRAVPNQIAKWVPGDYHALGADGFGFADTRPAARRFFHIDAQSVVVQALQALAERGEVKPEVGPGGVRQVPDRRPDRGARGQAGGRRRLTQSRRGASADATRQVRRRGRRRGSSASDATPRPTAPSRRPDCQSAIRRAPERHLSVLACQPRQPERSGDLGCAPG